MKTFLLVRADGVVHQHLQQPDNVVPKVDAGFRVVEWFDPIPPHGSRLDDEDRLVADSFGGDFDASGKARAVRDLVLQRCDWTQLPDAPIASAEKTAWAAYRQALRDLPNDPNWPSLSWPTPPAA